MTVPRNSQSPIGRLVAKHPARTFRLFAIFFASTGTVSAVLLALELLDGRKLSTAIYPAVKVLFSLGFAVACWKRAGKSSPVSH
jgi:hypothetical protein